jgi:aspartate aminotransferase
MPGVTCPVPGGAFYTIAQLPVENVEHFCQWLLEDFSYNNQTVMLAPANGFYSDPQKGLNEVRIAYVLNKKDLENAMDCLEKALEIYPYHTLKSKQETTQIK